MLEFIFCICYILRDILSSKLLIDKNVPNLRRIGALFNIVSTTDQMLEQFD